MVPQQMRPVLIVEDHPLVAEATGGLLARYGHDVTTTVCANAAQTIAALDTQPVDWFRIFLDLDVPGAYGLSLAREIRDRQQAAKCCVVSAFERQDYIEELRAWGFLGYIVKALPMAEFTRAISDVINGISHFPTGGPPDRATSPVRLTRRQADVLELVQAGLSSKQIASELHLAEGTVNNLVAAIVQLFDAGSRTHAVARAIELGVLKKHPDSPQLAPPEPTVQPRGGG